MINKTPENNKFYVSNGSDLTPNIQYVHNIDMDEEGYLKQSAPMVKWTSTAEIADFGIVSDIISISTPALDKYKVITDVNIYDIDLDSFTTTLDASAPTNNDTDSRFVGWKGGDWYVNAISDIYSLQSPAGTTWDVENTDGGEYGEVFVSRNTYCLVQGNDAVTQYLTTDMDGTTPPSTNSGPTLNLPENFSVTGMAYSTYRMGIATKNDTGGTAYFFTWDGATTSAQQGYPVYANSIIDLCAYKDSWALLTSAGQLLYFNGSGFDVLGNLPPYFKRAQWIDYSDTIDHGRTMSTDGDIIYFNFGTQLAANEDDSGLLVGFYSGVWCYDPDMGGIYHRYGLSHSSVYKVSLSPSSGTYTSSSHYLETGDRVFYAGIDTYFAIKLTANTFKLADTYDLAILGTATSDTVNGDMTWIKRTDWSQMISPNVRFGACLNIPNGNIQSDEGVLPFFAGLSLNTKAMAADDTLNVLATAFDNVSTICYSKEKSEEIESTYQSVVVKHSKLYHNDKVIVKYKLDGGYTPIGIGEAGDSSPDVFVTWVDGTSFTTTIDLSAVSTGDEVTFVTGAGAGSSSHISTLTNNAGTWTVVVDETIRGGEVGNKSCIIIDSFKKLATITKSNSLGVYTARLGKNSKSIQVKLEIRGKGIVIEEKIVNSEVLKPVV